MTEEIEFGVFDVALFGFAGIVFFASGVAALSGGPDLLLVFAYSVETMVLAFSIASGVSVPVSFAYGLTAFIGFLVMLSSVGMALEVLASDD